MEEFKCTKATVYNRNEKLGIVCLKKKREAKYPKELKLLPTGYAETHTPLEMAKYCEVSVATIYTWRKKFDLKMRDGRNKSGNQDRDTMIKYLSKEFTYDSIGREFKISRQRVEQIVNK